MTVATDNMRRAYLHAALDTKGEVMGGSVARSYVGEKVDIAFRAEHEEDLLSRLDLQRRSMYYRYLRERA